MTNEEREQLPAKLRELARAFSPEEHCRCDIEVGFICDLCGCSFWMRRAAEEIERLAAVSNIAVQEAARWLFAFRDRDSHAPDYASPVEVEQRMRRAIEGEAARLLRQKDTSAASRP